MREYPDAKRRDRSHDAMLSISYVPVGRGILRETPYQEHGGCNTRVLTGCFSVRWNFILLNSLHEGGLTEPKNGAPSLGPSRSRCTIKTEFPRMFVCVKEGFAGSE